ncbi:efflux RND transporter periplasmic adaptor subunit [Arenicella chitinivorans]|nr:efflux RND transporter periplasmic adaptor subunit [Arenicella chitinivorans]
MNIRRRPWLTVILVCLALFVVLALIKFFQIRAAIAFGESFPEPSETVHAQTVSFSEWHDEVRVVGEVRAPQAVDIRNEVAGVVARIGAESGAEIKQGEVLLELDYAEEAAELASINADLELARKDVKRLKGLVSTRAVSQQQADEAQARLASANARVEAVRQDIANKTILAPFDGRIGLHNLQLGEYLLANTIITRAIGNSSLLWVDFAVPQSVADIEVGTTVRVQLDSGTVYSASVIAVAPALESASRSVRVRASITDAGARLKSGHFVNVLVPSGTSEQIVRLPSTAVRVDALGAYAYVLNKDDTGNWRATRRPITLRAQNGNDSIIQSGLQIRDVVATKGSFKLREGLLTNISELHDAFTEPDTVPEPGQPPQTITEPQEVTPQEVTPQEVTPQEVTPQEVTPQEVTPQQADDPRESSVPENTAAGASNNE